MIRRILSARKLVCCNKETDDKGTYTLDSVDIKIILCNKIWKEKLGNNRLEF